MDMGEDNYLNQYNTISMDQRGLGRSFPNFAHPECTYGLTKRGNQKRSLAGAFNTDPTNDAEVLAFLDRQSARAANCWTKVPDFNLPSTDGKKEYHFLDFSGTQQTIEDLERFREVMGMKLLSMYGVSYGTQIAAAYATAFPQSVDKFVVDSNVTPQPDMLRMGTASAKNSNMMMNYGVYQCTAANALAPGTCPTADAGQCLGWVYDEVERMNTDESTDELLCCSTKDINEYMIEMVTDKNNWKHLKKPCKAAAENSPADLLKYLELVECSGTACSTRRRANVEGEAAKSKPTSKSYVYGNPEYPKLMGQPAAIPQTMIMAQTFAGQCYDKNFFLQQVKEINLQYPGLGTFNPSNSFMYWYGMGLYWPKSNPITPAGNPIQRGIVAGVMFDPATPYPWTQEMKAAFPMATLVSSQGKGHGTYSTTTKDDSPCLQVTQDYFTTGSVDVVDGATCRAPLPGPF